MFCNHKYGKVEGQYQYCTKCGVAKAVECNHKWETIKEIGVSNYNGKDVGLTYVQCCTTCGKIYSFKIKASD